MNQLIIKLIKITEFDVHCVLEHKVFADLSNCEIYIYAESKYSIFPPPPPQRSKYFFEHSKF